MNRHLALFLPLAIFLLIAAFLLKGLFSDPRERESSLIDKPVPQFLLHDLMDESIQYNHEVFKGQVTILNVWGTWCLTCKVEIPYLTSLREQGVFIVGLYFEQDTDPDFGIKPLATIRSEVTQMLQQLGNPYQFNIFDVDRQTSLDFGVTGAPETFLIDGQGVVRIHHIGDLNQRVWRSKFASLYQQLNQESKLKDPS